MQNRGLRATLLFLTKNDATCRQPTPQPCQAALTGGHRGGAPGAAAQSEGGVEVEAAGGWGGSEGWGLRSAGLLWHRPLPPSACAALACACCANAKNCACTRERARTHAPTQPQRLHHQAHLYRSPMAPWEAGVLTCRADGVRQPHRSALQSSSKEHHRLQPAWAQVLPATQKSGPK